MAFVSATFSCFERSVRRASAVRWFCFHTSAAVPVISQSEPPLPLASQGFVAPQVGIADDQARLRRGKRHSLFGFDFMIELCGGGGRLRQLQRAQVAVTQLPGIEGNPVLHLKAAVLVR